MLKQINMRMVDVLLMIAIATLLLNTKYMRLDYIAMTVLTAVLVPTLSTHRKSKKTARDPHKTVPICDWKIRQYPVVLPNHELDEDIAEFMAEKALHKSQFPEYPLWLQDTSGDFHLEADETSMLHVLGAEKELKHTDPAPQVPKPHLHLAAENEVETSTPEFTSEEVAELVRLLNAPPKKRATMHGPLGRKRRSIYQWRPTLPPIQEEESIERMTISRSPSSTSTMARRSGSCCSSLDMTSPTLQRSIKSF
eukprot:Filipodium_phascolosomae@DN1372_c0_g1_i1.p1